MSGAIPNLWHLQVFQQVVQRSSLSAAARVVHMTQPAVTQAIGGIETAINSELFRRSPSGMQLTVAGQVFAKRVTRTLSQLFEGCTEAGRGRLGDAAGSASPIPRGITAALLNALIAVAEQGSFAAAARSLGIARSTLHRAARQLERLLGVSLFEQTSFGLCPTREADRLASRARLAFTEIEQARAEIGALTGEGGGRTVIGALPLARSWLVPTVVLEFATAHPEHTVSILDGPYDSMLMALRQGSADFLVGALRDPGPHADVMQEHLFDDPLALIMRSGHPLARNAAPTLRELSEYPWIAPREGAPLRRHYETLARELVPVPRVRPRAPIECNSLVAARALLLASDRVMLLSAHQIHHELAAGQLIALAHPLGRVVRPIGLTLRRDWVPTTIQTILLDEMRRQGRASETVLQSPARNARGETCAPRVKKRVK